MTTTLSNGIVIHDKRDIQCGVRIENQPERFMSLCYGGKKGFYLSLKGFWLTESELQAYCEEFEMMTKAMTEANQLLDHTPYELERNQQ